MDTRERVARLLARQYWRGRGQEITDEMEDEFWLSFARDAEAICAIFDEERAATKLEIDSADLRLWMIVEELGGIVEGFPTSRINYLQRIRELRRIEQERTELCERVEQAEEDSLLMQGCNDLVIRDRAEDQAKLAAAEAREAALVVALDLALTWAPADRAKEIRARALAAAPVSGEGKPASAMSCPSCEAVRPCIEVREWMCTKCHETFQTPEQLDASLRADRAEPKGGRRE